MRTVWKYELPHDATLKVYGGDPKVVHVGVDPTGHYTNHPTVWVELEPNVEGNLELCFFGTGFDIPDGLEHVGSCITFHGFVWHVYQGAQGAQK